MVSIALPEEIGIPVVEITGAIGVEGAVRRENAKLVIPKTVESEVGFFIGEPEEILQVRVEEIELLPPLIRLMVRGSGMWGIVKSEDGPVILVDLAEIARSVGREQVRSVLRKAPGTAGVGRYSISRRGTSPPGAPASRDA